MNSSKKLGFYRTTTVKRAFIMLAVDILGYVLLFPYVVFRRKKGMTFDPQKATRIAVFRLDGIGDLIMSEPALKALRAVFPNAHICLFVNKWTDSIAELFSGHDEIMQLDAPMFNAFKGKLDWSDVLKERRVIRRLGRSQPFDFAIDLRGDILSIITAYWLGAQWLVSRASRAGGFLLTNVIRQLEEGNISESKLNQNFVGHLSGSKIKHEKAVLKLLPESRKQEFLNKFLMQTGKDYICLVVAAPYEARCYPVDKWVEVIELIRREYNGPIVILGAEEDFERCESVVCRAGKNVYNVAGKFSLMESVNCIAGARVLIGNDGGLIHIASAVNLPVVQLFGPADSVCFGHHGKHEHVIHKECPYNPCNETHCRIPQNWCMDRITPEEIFETALPYLRVSKRLTNKGER